MDFILKLFTRCMALAVVFMPCYGIAALQTSVQVQGNVLPGVQVGFEASTVEAFKNNVDACARPKKLMRKRTVQNKTRGFFKGIAAFFLGSAATLALFVLSALIAVPVFVWFFFSAFFPFLHVSLVIPSLVAPVILAGVLIGLTSLTAKSAYNDLAGRDEFVAVKPDDYEVLYVQVEEA